MHVTLLLAGALLPSDAAAAASGVLQTSALAARLRRATVGATEPHSGFGVIDWLGRHALHLAQPPPTAPYALAALGGEPMQDFVWHADPVHLALARDHLVVMPLPSPLSDAEADALIESANAVVAPDGVRVERVSGHWFLRAPRRWAIDAVAVADAAGAPLHEVLPSGNDAPVWLRLLNEIQMSWHVHPVNEAREARGEPPVNSLWLHGGGAWSPLPTLPYTAVHSDAPDIRGIAAATGTPLAPADAPLRDGALAVWTDLSLSRALNDWPAWQAALARSTRTSRRSNSARRSTSC